MEGKTLTHWESELHVAAHGMYLAATAEMFELIHA
jgi:hypothetical protein